MIFNYTPDLTGLTVLKTKEEQYKSFFYKGHPEFLIPDFSPTCPLQDIWTGYLDFLDGKSENGEVYDQDGGEITTSNIAILDPNTGLTRCIYEAYGIVLNEDDEPTDIEVEIEGYVVTDSTDNTYFVATKVTENS
jgi:hypothetical protein